MTNQHPITPPPKLVARWRSAASNVPASLSTDPRGSNGRIIDYISTKAARWGADQELEACCKTLEDIWDNEDLVTLSDVLRWLRAARRPKPPSLKEQAKADLDRLIALIPTEGALAMAEPIRRALEQLDD
jgi:hypothetical protein